MTFRTGYRSRLRQDAPLTLYGWAALVVMWFAFGVAVLAFASVLFALYVLYPYKPALGATLYPVPAECAALAQQHGLPDALTREQAVRAIAKLDAKLWLPGVRLCRGAVRREWKL